MPRLLPLLLVLGACAAVPPAPPHVFVPSPPVSTPLEVCWLELAGTTVAGGLGSAGASRAGTWAVTTSALLIRHPRGDLLLDTGLSPTAAQDAEEVRGWRRFVFDQTAGRNAMRARLPDLLAALGVGAPTAIILSHAHADHAGGASLFPGVPVWVAAPEARLIEASMTAPGGVVLPAQARALAGRLQQIPFTPAPRATWDESWDVFGDGAVVVVPTFGHTPGSVATFITVSPGLRMLHVGDLINMTESLERAVGKSAPMRWLTDVDEAATAAQVAKLVQLHALDPSLVVLPAHDRATWLAVFGEPGAKPPCRGTAPAVNAPR